MNGSSDTDAAAARRLREIEEADLERLIDLDAEAGGMRREDFIRKRWRAMQSDPDAYLAFVATEGRTIDGFAMAHVLSGEFGADERYAILDSFAVHASKRGAGIGKSLIDAVKNAARERRCAEVRTQVEWARQDLLAFLAGLDFSPAPVIALERGLE